MNMHRSVAPRSATTPSQGVRREGRPVNRRGRLAALAAGTIVAVALAACSTGVTATPLPISSALPNVNPSAIASAAAGAAMTALDQVDSAITANTNASGLSADDAASLTQLTSALRTALQSGDTTAAQTALSNLSTKADSFAAKLNNATGQQLTSAIAALKAAMPTS